MEDNHRNHAHLSSSFGSLKKVQTVFIIWRNERNRALLALTLLLLCLLGTFFASLILKHNIEKDATNEFQFACNEVNIKISGRLNANAQLLRSQAAWMQTTRENVNRETWRNVYEHLNLDRNLPGIQGIGYAVIIPPNELERHQQTIRKEGFPTYQVRPQGKREIYTSIIFLEPFSDRNLRAFGYDMFSEPTRRTAMERARDNNTASLSGKIILVQETSKDIQAGTLLYAPVYNNSMSTRTVEERRRAILGWVYSPYRMNDLMSGILGGYEETLENRIHLSIYDSSACNQDALLYDSKLSVRKDSTETPFLSHKSSISFNEHQWYLQYSQYNSGSSGLSYDKVWYNAIGGIGISFLAFALYLSLISTNIRAKILSDELTGELSESEAKYRLLSEASTDFIVYCDSDSKISYLNTAGLVFSGLTEQNYKGRNLFEFIPQEYHQVLQQHFKVRLDELFSGPRYSELELINLKGITIPVEVVSNPILYNGKLTGFISVGRDISSRKKANDALKESELRFKYLADTAPVLIWMSGQDTLCNYFNKPWLDFTGRTLEQEMGNGWVEGVHPDDMQHCLDTYLGSFTKRQNLEMEYRLLRADGEYRWLLDNGIPRFTPEGEFLGYIGSCWDITERKQMMMALSESENKYRELVENSPDAIAILAEGEIVFINSEGVSLMRAASSDDIIGKSFLDFVHPEYQAKVLDWMEKTQTEMGILPLAEEKFLRLDGSVAIVELKSMSINLDDKPAIQIIIRDITIRKQAEESIRQLSNYNRNLIEANLEALVTINQRGIIDDVNLATERMTGFSREKLIGTDFSDYFTEPIIAAAGYQQVFREGIVRDDPLQLRHLDGHTTPVSYNATLYRDENGQVQGVFASARDMTENYRIEIELRESEQKFRTIIETSPDAIAIFDANVMVAFMNPVAVNMFGYNSAEEMIGLSSYDFFMPEDQEKAVAVIQQIFVEGAAKDIKFPLTRKNGSSFKSEFSCSALYGSDQKPTGILAVIRDITERVSAEETQKKEKQRLSSILEGTNVGTWEWNVQTGEIIFNDRWAELIGYTLEELSPTNSETRNKYSHPDDIKDSDELLTKHFNGELDYYEFESRMLHKTGKWIWVLDRGRVNKWDTNGKPLIMSGTHQDITERKIIEGELRIASERLFNVMENTGDIIAMMDTEYCYQMFNSAFSDETKKIFGKEIRSGDSMIEMLAELPEDLANSLASWNRAFAGEDFIITQQFGSTALERNWYELHFSPLRDNHGKIIGAVHIVRNATARVLAEEEILRINTELNKVNKEKDKFFSIIAHDLRSPFSGLLGLTELMTSEGQSLTLEEYVSFSKGLRRSIVNLYKLLENLLEWAQLKKGTIGFAPVELNLASLFSQSLETISQRAAQKGINITFRFSENYTVFGDEKMINTILRNLLSNSVKFTREGGKVIASAQATPEGMIEISIADTGVGIPGKVIDKLFIIGEKVGTTGTNKEPSTGLGLILCKEFVEKNNGTIRVKSEEGIGSTFSFTLPGSGD